MGSGEAKICPLISTMPSEVSQRVEGAGPIITPRPLPAEPQVAMATPSDGDRGQCRRPLTAHSLLMTIPLAPNQRPRENGPCTHACETRTSSGQKRKERSMCLRKGL